ncbi:Gfo/Idh/MocA family protein [Anaeroarcus burkinensis]|uniref:Gfo/Idh/MocA family protein n=1 Tax=Anaeroarcus burkinensis TaxID=82376 RepID=UPI000410BB69|nr:Gfo/Idh/MocA family oxidoreductase [Anaeroarcus burkinensis]
MKTIVVGYGSIGSRHVRILNELGCKVAVVSRRKIDYNLRYSSIEEAIAVECPQYVVIANRTSEHLETLQTLRKSGFAGTILLEKPAFDQYLEVPKPLLDDVYVAYNLRFHPMLQKAKRFLETQKILSVQAYVGQYLPTWRPGTDYRLCYSARKNEGGGVLRDLSHELDYLLWLLGDWTEVVAQGGNFSSLEIDSDDLYGIMLKTKKCPLTILQLNYLDRVAKREVLINTEDHTIKLDLIKGSFWIDNDEEMITIERDYTYAAEHQAILGDEKEFLCSLKKGVEVMQLVDSVEKSVAMGSWILR